MEALIDGVGIASKEQGKDSNVNSNTEVILRPHVGQKITLKCLESSNGQITIPTPEFTFLKNGNPVASLQKHSQNSLTFQAEADDTYKCEAKNKLGKKLSNVIALEIQSKFQTG